MNGSLTVIVTVSEHRFPQGAVTDGGDQTAPWSFRPRNLTGDPPVEIDPLVRGRQVRCQIHGPGTEIAPWLPACMSNAAPGSGASATLNLCISVVGTRLVRYHRSTVWLHGSIRVPRGPNLSLPRGGMLPSP